MSPDQQKAESEHKYVKRGAKAKAPPYTFRFG
jgi:hypothetical protein